MKSFFVSSTFRDMQSERDILANQVFPTVSKFVATLGDSFSYYDFRWGINTDDLESDIGAEKVLSVCFKTIDKCERFMIILIGERYGWIPNEKLIDKVEKENKFSFSNEKMSITSMEIEYGLQSFSDSSRCLVYFRNPLSSDKMNKKYKDIFFTQSDEEKNKLDALKKSVIDSGALVRYYDAEWDPKNNCVTALDEFAQTVTKDLIEMLSKYYSEPEDWQQTAINMGLSEIKRGHQTYAQLNNIVSQAKSAIENDGKDIVLISGKSGSGKSTVLCELANVLNENNIVVPIFCSSGSKVVRTSNLLEVMSYSLSKHLNTTLITHQSGSRAHFIRLLNDFNKQSDTKLIFAIDAIDSLLDSSEALTFDFIPEEISEKVCIIVATTLNSNLPHRIKKRCSDSHFIIPPLDIDAKKKMIIAKLSSRSKEISENALNKIIAKKGSDNPLYLSMLIDMLFAFDTNDFMSIAKSGISISEYVERTVNRIPERFSALCKYILDDVVSNKNKAMFNDVMLTLLATRRGISLNALAQITGNQKWNEVEFLNILNLIPEIVTEKSNGIIDFSHPIIRETFNKQFKVTPKNHKLIIDYLCSTGANLSPTADRNSDNPLIDEFSRSELLWHTYKAGDTERTLMLILLQQYYSLSANKKLGKFNAHRDQSFAKTYKDIFDIDGGKWALKVCPSRKKTLEHYPYIIFVSNHLSDCMRSKSDTERFIKMLKKLRRKASRDGRNIIDSIILSIHAKNKNTISAKKHMKEMRCSAQRSRNESLWSTMNLIEKVRILNSEGKSEEAMELLSHAKDSLGITDNDKECMAILEMCTLSNKSIAAKGLGQLDKSLDYAKQALAIIEPIATENSMTDTIYQYSSKLANVGNVLEALGDSDRTNRTNYYDEAYNYFAQALAVSSDLLNSERSEKTVSLQADNLSSLGALLGRQKKYEECHRYMDQANVMYCELFEDYQKTLYKRNIAQDSLMHAFMCKNEQNWQRAAELNSAAYEIMCELGSERGRVLDSMMSSCVSDLCLAYQNIGKQYWDAGCFAKALEFSYKAADMLAANLDRNSYNECVNLCISYSNIASTLYKKLGDFERGYEMLLKTFECFSRKMIIDNMSSPAPPLGLLMTSALRAISFRDKIKSTNKIVAKAKTVAENAIADCDSNHAAQNMLMLFCQAFSHAQNAGSDELAEFFANKAVDIFRKWNQIASKMQLNMELSECVDYLEILAADRNDKNAAKELTELKSKISSSLSQDDIKDALFAAMFGSMPSEIIKGMKEDNPEMSDEEIEEVNTFSKLIMDEIRKRFDGVAENDDSE